MVKSKKKIFIESKMMHFRFFVFDSQSMFAHSFEYFHNVHSPLPASTLAERQTYLALNHVFYTEFSNFSTNEIVHLHI